MRRALLAAFAVLGLTAAPAQADAIDDYLRRAAERAHIPAMAVAVVKDGRIVKLAAYGSANLDHATPATPDTAFSIASGTKVFTGILTMRMVEQGKLKLSDTVGDHLADVPDAWKAITVAELAAHASGLPDVTGRPDLPNSAALIAWARNRPLVFAPGERSVYSQTEFTVLSEILAKVSGRSFEALLEQEVVTPLGLTSTRYSNLRQDDSILASTARFGDVVPRRATLYRWDGARQETFEHLFPRYGYSAAGLFSSAADLAKVFQALEEGRLLSRASVRTISTPFRLRDGKEAPFGVAWIVRRWRGRTVVGHSGGPAHSDIWWHPDQRLVVAVLTNQVALGPVLADEVAALADDVASPRHQAIRDPDPATSARLYDWVRGATDGTIERSALSADAPLGMVDALQFLAPTVATFPPSDGWELIAAGEAAGLRTRTYAGRHGASRILWSFTLSPKGEIVQFYPQPE